MKMTFCHRRDQNRSETSNLASENLRFALHALTARSLILCHTHTMVTRPCNSSYLLDKVEKLYPPGSCRKLNPILSQDVDGNTSLHHCCQTCSTYRQVVKHILQVCPQCIGICNTDKNAMQVATENLRLVDDICKVKPKTASRYCGCL